TSATAKRVGELKSLQAIAALSLFANDVQHSVYEFSTLGVMSLCPVVTSARLPENEVIWPEELTERSRSNTVHGAGFQINEDGAGNVFATYKNEILLGM